MAHQSAKPILLVVKEASTQGERGEGKGERGEIDQSADAIESRDGE
jgi:hypothetical protein